MAIEMNCPECGALLTIDDKNAGKQERCRYCHYRFLVPETTNTDNDEIDSGEQIDKVEVSAPGGADVDMLLATGEISAEEYESLTGNNPELRVPSAKEARRDDKLSALIDSKKKSLQEAGHTIAHTVSSAIEKSAPIVRKATSRGIAWAQEKEPRLRKIDKSFLLELMSADAAWRERAKGYLKMRSVRIALVILALMVIRSFFQSSESSSYLEYVSSINTLREQADQGDVTAQVQLAEMYLKGEEVQTDEYKAQSLFEKAAKRGDMEAQYALGDLYDNGNGSGRRYQDAAQWYVKAAEQGHHESQYRLSVMYYRGRGVAQNYVQAYAWAAVVEPNGAEYVGGIKVSAAEHLSPQQRSEAQQLVKELTKKIRANR